MRRLPNNATASSPVFPPRATSSAALCSSAPSAIAPAAPSARGEGHPVAVLAIGYPGGTIRQISLPQEQVTHVRCCLANYRKLKAALEKICELNQQLLRSERDGAKTRRPGD